MTFATTASMRWFPSDPPFLPFWAWSGLLHVGAIALFSFVHVTNKIEQTRSVVNVTLVESLAPNPTPSPAKESKQKEPAPKIPHLLNAQRSAPSVPQQTIPTPQLLKTPTVRTTLAQVAVPSKPRERVLPSPRRVLRDLRADNHVDLKSYLKVAQRTPAARSNVQHITPQLDVSSSATILPTNILTRTPTPQTSRAIQTTPRSLTSNILKAMAPGTGSISKSKVGLGRTIPPVYPRIARESGWEGTVVVRVAIQPDGRPDSIKVRKSSGHPILDEAAVEAVKKWKFSPAKDGNIPIRSVVEIPINFDLRQQG